MSRLTQPPARAEGAAWRAEADRAWAVWAATGAKAQPGELEAPLPPGWWWSEVLNARAFPPVEPGWIGLVVQVTASTYPGPIRTGPVPSPRRTCSPGWRVVTGIQKWAVSSGIIWANVERVNTVRKVKIRGGYNTSLENWRMMDPIQRLVGVADLGEACNPLPGRVEPMIDRRGIADRIADLLGDHAAELPPYRPNGSRQ